jgi:hypothetical protein
VVMVLGGRAEFRPKYMEEHPEVKGVAAVSLPHPSLPNPVSCFKGLTSMAYVCLPWLVLIPGHQGGGGEVALYV